MNSSYVVAVIIVLLIAVVVTVDALFSEVFLGTADGECWNCPGIRSVRLEIPESMNPLGADYKVE